MPLFLYSHLIKKIPIYKSCTKIIVIFLITDENEIAKDITKEENSTQGGWQNGGPVQKDLF